MDKFMINEYEEDNQSLKMVFKCIILVLFFISSIIIIFGLLTYIGRLISPLVDLYESNINIKISENIIYAEKILKEHGLSLKDIKHKEK